MRWVSARVPVMRQQEDLGTTAQLARTLLVKRKLAPLAPLLPPSPPERRQLLLLAWLPLLLLRHLTYLLHAHWILLGPRKALMAMLTMKHTRRWRHPASLLFGRQAKRNSVKRHATRL